MAVGGLQHVLVLTDDIDATRDFWCGALELEEGERPLLEFPGYWLYAGGAPCVHVAERAAYEAHSKRIGIAASALPVDHVAFGEEGYDEVVARLERRGIEPAANEVPGAGLRQLFIQDPNGVKVEINVKEQS